MYDLYLVRLNEAVMKIHEAGVIHIDLYPSNILWRCQDDNIVIRIVDWDVATLKGHSLTEEMLERLATAENLVYYWFSGQADPRCDYWFLFILSNLTENERQTMNGEASTVNWAYQDSVNRQRKADEFLNDTFEQWYCDQGK